jgi:hypothetical protein
VLVSHRRFDQEPPRLFKSTTGAETRHWASERSCIQDSPRFKTLAYRRPSDSSSAVSSTSAPFFSAPPDGVSPSDPSPVLPLTPHMSAPFSREPHDLLSSPMKEVSGNNRMTIPSHTCTDAPRPATVCDRDRLQVCGPRRRSGDLPSPRQAHRTEVSPTLGPTELWNKRERKFSSSHPVRPW